MLERSSPAVPFIYIPSGTSHTTPRSDIQALQYPHGERIPLVSNILTTVSHNVDLVVLDVKVPDNADTHMITRMHTAIRDLLSTHVRCEQARNCTTVWSKHDGFVRAYKAHDPGTPVGFIVGEPHGVDGQETDEQRVGRCTRIREAEVVGAVWSVLDAPLVATLHGTVRVWFSGGGDWACFV